MIRAFATGGGGSSTNSRVSTGSIQTLLKGGKEKYAYNTSELRRLAEAHQSGDATLKRQIENRLTDINYHTEASSFREGDYTTLEGTRLLGRGSRLTTTRPVQPQIGQSSSSSMGAFYRRAGNPRFGANPRIRTRR